MTSYAIVESQHINAARVARAVALQQMTEGAIGELVGLLHAATFEGLTEAAQEAEFIFTLTGKSQHVLFDSEVVFTTQGQGV